MVLETRVLSACLKLCTCQVSTINNCVAFDLSILLYSLVCILLFLGFLSWALVSEQERSPSVIGMILVDMAGVIAKTKSGRGQETGGEGREGKGREGKGRI